MKTKTSDEAEGLKKLLQQEKCKSRQLEKALRRSEEKYREIFEIITDIHFSASPDGRIIDISQPVDASIGVWPGDSPFEAEFTWDMALGASWPCVSSVLLPPAFQWTIQNASSCFWSAYRSRKR